MRILALFIPRYIMVSVCPSLPNNNQQVSTKTLRSQTLNSKLYALNPKTLKTKAKHLKQGPGTLNPKP